MNTIIIINLSSFAMFNTITLRSAACFPSIVSVVVHRFALAVSFNTFYCVLGTHTKNANQIYSTWKILNRVSDEKQSSIIQSELFVFNSPQRRQSDWKIKNKFQWKMRSKSEIFWTWISNVSTLDQADFHFCLHRIKFKSKLEEIFMWRRGYLYCIVWKICSIFCHCTLCWQTEIHFGAHIHTHKHAHTEVKALQGARWTFARKKTEIGFDAIVDWLSILPLKICSVSIQFRLWKKTTSPNSIDLSSNSIEFQIICDALSAMKKNCFFQFRNQYIRSNRINI